MVLRFLIATALFCVGGPVQAARGDPAPASFEQRIVAVIARPSSPDAMRAALARLSKESQSRDEQVTIDGFRTMIDGWQKSEAKGLADAEAFAAANPRSGGAQIALAYAQGRADEAEKAADSLIAGLALDPGLVDAVSSSPVAYMLGKFRIRQDNARTLGLARALFEAGWTRGNAGDRSFLATQLILYDLGKGNGLAARKWLPIVLDPERLYVMLADNRFSSLRSEIEASAGSRLEIRWRDYLILARDSWSESGEADDASAYAGALQKAKLHRTLVDQLLPRFVRGYNCPNDPVARSVAYYLVGSLVELGQFPKAENVLYRSASAGGSVDANYLSYLYVVKGRYAAAAAVLGRMLGAMAKAKTPVDPLQVTLLQARLACANHQRGAVADSVAIDGLALGARLWIARCLDRPAEAKAQLLAALERDGDRLEALAWLQPVAANPAESAFERAMRAASDSLRRDPQIVAAVARHGIIHDWSVTASVPQNLAPARSKRPPPCGTYRTEPEDRQQVEELVEKRRPMP
ncbi:MAG: hypothetical protein LH610_08605 [Sphingomonas bacterium]|nr:hypothetical protein [Sphingomonas bacterium]